MPCSASSAAVPPVEMISTPSSASARAKSTTPRLSNTVNRALSTRRSPGIAWVWTAPLVCGSAIVVEGPFVHADPPGVLPVHADRALGDQADGTGQEPVFGVVENPQ